MKTITAISLLIALVLVPLRGGFSQDNIYGDYLIYSLEEEVSLDLESAELVDVLKMFSQQTGLNFISTEAVQSRKLTLYLQNVPLKEAMDIIFKANNLAYDYYPDSRVFVVKEMGKPELELKAKVYRLKYARLGSSRIQIEIDDAMESSTRGGGTRGGGTRGGGGRIGFGIAGAVRGVLSKSGRLSEDAQTNSLIVVDVPVQFPMIDEVIAKLDIPIPKVMIEVEMMDVAKSHLDKLGFNWENGATAEYFGSKRETTFPFPTHLIPGGLAREFTLGTLAFDQLKVVMNFLSQETTTKFLARPKILTLSNETAEVKLTVDEAIGLTTTSSQGVETQNVEREETGTKLRVTPQVNILTNEITLFVEMFNRESTDSGLIISGLTDGNIKNIEERSTKSLVRLKNGETLYIGGLIKRETTVINKKIPFLGDLPIVGRFFRSREVPGASNQDRELLVFLTPRIMPDNSTLVKKVKIFPREQQNDVKDESVRLALDSFSR